MFWFTDIHTIYNAITSEIDQKMNDIEKSHRAAESVFDSALGELDIDKLNAELMVQRQLNEKLEPFIIEQNMVIEWYAATRPEEIVRILMSPTKE